MLTVCAVLGVLLLALIAIRLRRLNQSVNVLISAIALGAMPTKIEVPVEIPEDGFEVAA